jgi:hypothetical protein
MTASSGREFESPQLHKKKPETSMFWAFFILTTTKVSKMNEAAVLNKFPDPEILVDFVASL